MRADAHNHSAAIEQTRKDRSEVDDSRHQERVAAEIREGRSARPNGSSNENSTPCPRASAMRVRAMLRAIG
jgi:hypothetical protein